MKLTIERSVTVITPTIGSSKLKDAVASVENQTYSNIKHLIVIDGPEYFTNTMENLPVTLDYVDDSYQNINVTYTPNNTGANGFYGHRIYAGYPHFINTDYIFLLDEDNWYEPDHVKSLVEVLDAGNDFAYSFRKVYDQDKKYIADDNCEALGKWPIYFSHDNPQYLIDTSSFAFKREFLIKTCQHWHHGWGGDRNYFYNALRYNPKWDTNYKHTLCYRTDSNPNSPDANFFMNGNQKQLEHYKGKLPWIF
jgi:glycosyltransferase involved in cell wall biosynthesis